MIKNPVARLAVLTAVAMIAFAANSILNRLALAEGQIGPAAFAVFRVGSGVVVLALLLALRERSLPRPAPLNMWAVFGLTAYMLGFSFAYVSMDAGVGALVLFGGVQITMFLAAVFEGDAPPLQKWAGMGLALLGLAVVSWPAGAVSIPALALGLMVLAALGWGIYSLMGRKVSDPLQATAWNFAYCLPIVGLVCFAWPDTQPANGTGILLATMSGGITSALGYALWYALLPNLGAVRAALAQLSVPIIAIGLGALFLGEALSWTIAIATTLVIGGIAIGLTARKSD